MRHVSLPELRCRWRRSMAVLGMLGSLLVATPVAAVQWDGDGATSEWSERANWEFDVVPSANDSAVIVGAVATITGAAPPAVGSVSLGGATAPGGLTLTGTTARAQLTALQSITVNPSGTLEIGRTGVARSLALAGSVATSGAVVVGSRGDLLVDGEIVQTAGTFDVNSGATLQAEALLSHAGLLQATGALQAKVVVGDGSGASATLSPGAGLGALTIDGDLSLDSDARLLIQLAPAGTSLRTDTIQVTGEVRLGGVLELSQLVSGPLTPGAQISFLQAAGFVPGSRFDDIVGLELGGGSLVPSFDLTGNGSVTYSILRGDMNGDQAIDELDVERFAWAIRDGASYHQHFVLQGNSAFASMADMDLDGDRTWADIPLFLDAVEQGGGSMAAAMATLQAVFAPVPEPSTAGCASWCAALIAAARRRKVGARSRTS